MYTSPSRLLIFTGCVLGITAPALAQVAGEKPPDVPAEASPRPLDARFDEEELAAFLARRTSSSVVGTFGAYCSLLFVVDGVALTAEGGFDAANVELRSTFVASYRPTWREKLDMICRQIGAAWRYDHASGHWMLRAGPLPVPYELKIADGWSARDQGNHVVFVPPNSPVGMDVYVVGHYTPETDAGSKALFDAARADAAERFAKLFDAKASAATMTTVKVADADALFFEAPAPGNRGITWRQWAFVKHGWCVLVVSAISAEHEAVNLPAVKAMVESLRMTAADAGESERKPEPTPEQAESRKSR